MRYSLAMLIVSSASMTVEIVAARMLAPLVGMTVFSWTAVIATVLAGLSLGHWVGGRLATNDRAAAHRWLVLLLLAAGAATLAPVPLIDPIADLVFALGPGWLASTALIAGLGFFVPSFLAGAITPILTTAAVAADPGRTGRVIGWMYALGAGGAIGGTLLAGLVLLQWIGSNGSLALVAVVEAALVLAFLGRRHEAVLGGAAALVLAGLSAAALAAAPYCQVESRYYCLSVRDTSAWAGFPSRGLVMDGWVQSVEPTDGSDRLAIDAHGFLDAWARRRFPPDHDWRAYFIGGGGFSLPTRWTERWPQASATVAEIDPAVTALAESEGFLRRNARIRVIDDDARAALRDRELGRFDLVFSDAYSGHTMPAHLVSLEFHRLVRDHLRPGGVYAINAHDWAGDPAFLEALVGTLERVFDTVTVWNSGHPIQPGSRSHFNVLATDGPIDTAPLSDAGGGSRIWAVDDRVLGRPPLLTDNYAPVDRLTMR